ncbi:class I SAM-dependent methyltransferase [Draconibacterium sp. IB214405]|uniref:class I SAM-dependent methyltransferase n=1 Tax=Draconibacterium sp. IB214405 TaxID=3097352 RepID=UPI002A0E7CB7|nr:class I SAM-dependent methyltransferase [Draconibacterium sp. IB214405]MDX8338687.1 class I SAM-dependent methyltransferase [Draconibacterium sp. IB214405]
MDRKKHWEEIYKSKNTTQVSWFQASPTTSLQFVKEFELPKTARIIDVGGGDSLMVDRLLEMGYGNITVLDISETAINKAQQRLGEKARTVKWIVADAAEFQPSETYDFWHDRAAFHFLTDKQEISSYVDTIRSYVKPGGYLVLGTFSEQGPTKCSGIEIKQYSETTMTSLLTDFFNKIRCITVDHKTPFNTLQNFVFCSFRRLAV